MLVSLVTEDGQVLLTGKHIIESSLNQQLSIQISVRGLIRFGNYCQYENGIMDMLLLFFFHCRWLFIKLYHYSLSFWPETNIGVLAVVDCPCGSNGTSSGGKLRATRYTVKNKE